MDSLPEDRIDQIPKSEHLISDAVKYPAPYPEDSKITIMKETWDNLVSKYGEEKVKQFYKIKVIE